MASLNKLAIRGIRSFDDKNIAVIEFFSPVTVIVGHNGSGKTTIIECLKYATTGDQPPNSRGGAFVHDPKIANEKEVKAQVKLRFVAANAQRMLVVRNLSVTMKKTAGLTMKTLESILSLADGSANGKRGTISTRCAEIDTEIPHLLGVSKAVLENVIFCHQEDSYWPLAEPAALKKKFDEIFEATKYTKALESIKSLRKERVAELKVDKERLESLAREKNHADKVKTRIDEYRTQVAKKELRHEKLREECDQLIASNKRFYESATQFREKYLEIEQLQKEVDRYTEELQNAMEHVKEMTEPDEVLEERRKNSDRYKQEAEQKLRKEERLLRETLEELEDARRSHVSLQQQRGALEAEKKKHEEDVEERNKEINRIANEYRIGGFEMMPYTREQIADFRTQLNEVMKKMLLELETLQNEASAKHNEFKDKQAALHTEHRLMKQRKSSVQDRITVLQRNINDSEMTLNDGLSLPRELSALQSDLQDKESRIDKIKEEMKDVGYDEKIQDIVNRVRGLEEQRENLNLELKNLSLQADARAKLDIKRADLKKKKQSLDDSLEIINPRFRKLIGRDVLSANKPEADVEQVLNEKEKEFQDAEIECNNANANLRHAESTLSSLKAQLKSKKDKARDIKNELDDALREGDNRYESVRAGIEEAEAEVLDRKASLSSSDETKRVYELMLKNGKNTKKCGTCNRSLQDHEMASFEKHLAGQIQKMSSSEQETLKEEGEAWEEELNRLQRLLPTEIALENLTSHDIPALEDQIRQSESSLPELLSAKNLAQSKLDEARLGVKETQALKLLVLSVTELRTAIEGLTKEIFNLEEDLRQTGTVKTADSVQEELGEVGSQIRKLEREKSALQNDREQQMNRLRRHQDEVHASRLQETELKNKVKEHNSLKQHMEVMRKELTEANEECKRLDGTIEMALQPLERQQREYDLYKENAEVAIRKSQDRCEQARRSLDTFNRANKDIETYVRNKRDRMLQDCQQQIEQHEDLIQNHEKSIDDIRENKSKMEKQIHESDSFLANLRENERIRKLRKDIAANKVKISAFDMEEAAKARRQFDDRYAAEKKREGDLEAEYSRLGGELSTMKDQLKSYEKDLSEFKDIYEQYTDQLIKVKMSDMANNDLEKYAKALDSAIMKYHSLKMEEVNDTMHHLWNKTYQGTDIDGIKISSDVEGGASKRSYNYRVVMTKDQVEMDMRGRCSAGQKMLASIIIRLALSDSFGQNCGILALDEPTNALDVDNIDALASSLVDIINERKNHANFQLIIITHDENFLKKLGQANVMEYYWRVSRDSRQKSIIERLRVA